MSAIDDFVFDRVITPLTRNLDQPHQITLSALMGAVVFGLATMYLVLMTGTIAGYLLVGLLIWDLLQIGGSVRVALRLSKITRSFTNPLREKRAASRSGMLVAVAAYAILLPFIGITFPVAQGMFLCFLLIWLASQYLIAVGR